MRFLILGQGLAGTLLSHEFSRLGLAFSVVDDGDPGAASRAAGGLFAPVTGQRTALMWRAADLIHAAREGYRALEAELGGSFLHEMPLYRVFVSAQQRSLYLKRSREASHRPFLGPLLGPDFFRQRGVDAPLGGMEVKDAGRLDVQALLAAWRARLKERGQLQERPAREEDFSGATTVIDCRGLGGRRDSPWIPFQPAKGETLVLRAESPGQEAIYYGSHFLLPLGGGRFRLGATYDREDLSLSPTQPKRAELEQGAAALCSKGFTVEAQPLGLRPNVQGHFPLIGPSPRGGFVFNGLGSKGVLWAPWGAAVLAAHLQEGAPIPPEVNSTRFHAPQGEKGKTALAAR